MLSVIGAITASRWLMEYLGLMSNDYHVLIEWMIVVILITIDED